MEQPIAVSATTKAQAHSSRLRRTMADVWKMRTLYIMLLPCLVWYFIFKYLPMYGVIISFKDYNFSDGILHSPWADPWYKYFEMFFQSPYFSQLLGNTLLISVYKLLFGMLPSILLAILFHECRISWLKRWVQTLSYMPHFLSWIVIYGISIAFLSETTGLLNRWITDMGGSAIPFLNGVEWFRSVLVSTEIWKDLGWGAIIYLAAISSIDPTLYEAAKVDGASRLRMIWHITLPGIRNVIVLLLILRIGSILDAGFEQVFVFYHQRVYEVGDIIDTWVYRTGLQQMNFSLGATVGLFKSAIGFILVFGTNKLAKRWGESIW
ncbi:putative multiple-sugar transport system permease YteP [Paenibacillus albidus]|uniref:Multiple-sugar transport system permease YteP n=1 Tax=Paenibacillus albidus TaxID=2041023 RepID=A0A917F852_9BACL|nr:ABC transporter permease subunit [Paenibacillus albidus]GGF59253.1 putative multiple-sugar transport system permease YteP [Paenibacillus albidus]